MNIDTILHITMTIAIIIVSSNAFIQILSRDWRSLGRKTMDDLCIKQVEEATARVRAILMNEIVDLKRQLQDERAKIEAIITWMSSNGQKLPEIVYNTPSNAVRSMAVLGIWVDYPIHYGKISSDREMANIIRSGYSFRALRGSVDRQSVLREIQETKPDILHFGGHGVKDGLVLIGENKDIDIVPPHFWTTVAKNSSIKIVILSACESLDIARLMSNAGINCVIGISGEVEDNLAAQLMNAWYLWFSTPGTSASKALETAKLSIPFDWQKTNEVVIIGDYP